MTKNKVVIAVDGPAASGKGSLSRRLSKDYNLAHMDSGKLYRATALIIIENNINPEEKNKVEQYIKYIDFDNSIFENKKLLSDEIGKTASIIANYKNLRDYLLKIQRDFAYVKNNDKLGVVIDGRDIGTVVLPEANIKFFITASLDVRITRRWKELLSLGYDIIKRHVEQEMIERDERDSHRTHSPLFAAPDAILLDTTKLKFDQVYVLAKKYVEVFLS